MPLNHLSSAADGGHAPALEASGASPPLLDAAISYAAGGWPVFPLWPRTKKPLTRHGFKDASTDPEQVRAWWTQWPRANIGLALGGSGPTLLDIDDLDAGAAAIARLDGAPYVSTGRGPHYFFAGGGERTLTLTYGELRGVGAYGVLPPSVHPSGAVYTWHGELGELAPVPAWIADDRKHTSGGLGAGDAPAVEHIAPGEGMHDHLVDFALRMVQARWLDVPTVAWHLISEFDRVRTAPAGDYDGGEGATRRIAEWAVSTELAERVRWEIAEDQPSSPPIREPGGDDGIVAAAPVYRRRRQHRRMPEPRPGGDGHEPSCRPLRQALRWPRPRLGRPHGRATAAARVDLAGHPGARTPRSVASLRMASA